MVLWYTVPIGAWRKRFCLNVPVTVCCEKLSSSQVTMMGSEHARWKHQLKATMTVLDNIQASSQWSNLNKELMEYKKYIEQQI